MPRNAGQALHLSSDECLFLFSLNISFFAFYSIFFLPIFTFYNSSSSTNPPFHPSPPPSSPSLSNLMINIHKLSINKHGSRSLLLVTPMSLIHQSFIFQEELDQPNNSGNFTSTREFIRNNRQVLIGPPESHCLEWLRDY